VDALSEEKHRAYLRAKVDQVICLRYYEGRLKFSGPAAVRRCYAEEGGECYAKL